MVRNSKYTKRDALPFAVNVGVHRIYQIIDTRIAYIKAFWWKIAVGKANIFRGRPIFRRHPSGSITIGNNCIFNSAEWSNTIGLNRRCIISATRNAELHIGNDSKFSGTVIAASNSIRIGNRVLCGGNCTIVDTDRHPLELEDRARNKQPQSSPIVIEDDVFLGMNVTVLKGSRIGQGSVVAANSVVTGKIPPGVIAAGSPARVIKVLQQQARVPLE